MHSHVKLEPVQISNMSEVSSKTMNGLNSSLVSNNNMTIVSLSQSGKSVNDFVHDSDSNSTMCSLSSVPLNNSTCATSAERPPSNFRAGTYQMKITEKEEKLNTKLETVNQCPPTDPQKSSTFQTLNPESSHQKSSQPTKTTLENPIIMSAFYTLFLQIILNKAASIINQLDDQPKKRLHRRLNYAHQMKKQNHSHQTRHTFRTEVTPLPESRKQMVTIPSSLETESLTNNHNNNLPTKNSLKRKLPEINQKQQLLFKFNQTQMMQFLNPSCQKLTNNSNNNLTDQSHLTNKIRIVQTPRLKTNLPNLSKNSPTCSQTSDQNSDLEILPKIASSRIRTISGDSLLSNSSLSTTTSSQDALALVSQEASQKIVCPVHHPEAVRDPSCLVCRKPMQTTNMPANSTLNMMIASDRILRQYHHDTTKAKTIHTLKQALQRRIQTHPDDPKNPLIQKAINSDNSEALIQIAKMVINKN